LVPTLSLRPAGGTLAVTGTPTAGPTEGLLVQNVGGDDYRVLDGTADLGAFRVTRDLR